MSIEIDLAFFFIAIVYIWVTYVGRDWETHLHFYNEFHLYNVVR